MYERIASLCANCNMSVRQLEIAIGISPGAMCRWNKNRPKIDSVFAVAQYFGVSMEYLLNGEQTAQGGLSSCERELIALFQSLTEAQQELVLVQLRALAQFQTKKDSRE